MKTRHKVHSTSPGPCTRRSGRTSGFRRTRTRSSAHPSVDRVVDSGTGHTGLQKNCALPRRPEEDRVDSGRTRQSASRHSVPTCHLCHNKERRKFIKRREWLKVGKHFKVGQRHRPSPPTIRRVAPERDREETGVVLVTPSDL